MYTLVREFYSSLDDVHCTVYNQTVKLDKNHRAARDGAVNSGEGTERAVNPGEGTERAVNPVVNSQKQTATKAKTEPICTKMSQIVKDGLF